MIHDQISTMKIWPVLGIMALLVFFAIFFDPQIPKGFERAEVFNDRVFQTSLKGSRSYAIVQRQNNVVLKTGFSGVDVEQVGEWQCIELF